MAALRVNRKSQIPLMFLAQLNNELWKLFGKKRTYIGFGAFLLSQNLVVILLRYTHWQQDAERTLAGNGYLAMEYISALTVAVIMLIPQIMLLMPLYTALVGGDLVARFHLLFQRGFRPARRRGVEWQPGRVQ